MRQSKMKHQGQNVLASCSVASSNVLKRNTDFFNLAIVGALMMIRAKARQKTSSASTPRQHLENTCHARSPPRAFESTAQAMYINYRLQKHAPYPARAICRSNVGKPLDNALCFYFQTLRRLVDERVHRFRLVLRQGDVAKSRRHGTQLKLLESGEIFILFGALVDGFRLLKVLRRHPRREAARNCPASV